MLNRIILMGRLTRDPELRHTQTGTPVASFSLAVDRDFKDKTTGEKSTDFIDVVAWRNSAEFVSRYFTKGRMAVVEGRLQIRPWQDRGRRRQRVLRGLQEGRGRRRGLPRRLPAGRLRRVCASTVRAVWPTGRGLSALQLRRRRLRGAGR